MYLIVMIVLLPSLKDLTIPLFYLCAGNLNNAIVLFLGSDVEVTNWYIITGAYFFVSSDSILAFNKFYNLVLSSFLIMLTYLVAQYLLYQVF
jgi:hypothetical protein